MKSSHSGILGLFQGNRLHFVGEDSSVFSGIISQSPETRAETGLSMADDSLC